MIKVDKLNVEVNGNAKDIVKELCYAMAEITERAYAQAKEGLN